MQCPHCSAENHEGARFCSACGGKVRVTAASQMAPRVLALGCVRCGQTLPPNTYFSRGINVAKLALLFPIYFVLPILFFFVRRDRLICAHCRKLLPDSAPRVLIPMGSTNSTDLVPHAGGYLIPSPRHAAALSLEQASLRARSRGIGLGVVSLPFSVGTLAMMGNAGLAQISLVAAPGALLVWGAVTALKRATHLKREAHEVEEKHQRRRVLDLASKRNGRLTVADVAASLGVDLKEAEHVLDSMVDGRHLDVEVTDAGRLLYVFPDLQKPD